MFKLRRFLAFFIDTILGMIISNYIGLGILTLLKMINTPLVIVGIVSTLVYFLFLYIFIVNKNYLIFQGQSLGHKIFKLQLNYNGKVADKLNSRKNNFIDFITFSLSMITILFYNKSIANMICNTEMCDISKK